ncbi:MAG: TIGR03643 family protein [Alphaproteobacteria bacterium]|nr:TIGR03643 family protein [Alphaproteobacteria bacterium]
MKHVEPSLVDLNQIIEFAWQDDVSFDMIKRQFGYSEDQVISLMRSNLKPSSFRCWRKRVTGRIAKHTKKVERVGSILLFTGVIPSLL